MKRPMRKVKPVFFLRRPKDVGQCKKKKVGGVLGGRRGGGSLGKKKGDVEALLRWARRGVEECGKRDSARKTCGFAKQNDVAGRRLRLQHGWRRELPFFMMRVWAREAGRRTIRRVHNRSWGRSHKQHLMLCSLACWDVELS